MIDADIWTLQKLINGISKPVLKVSFNLDVIDLNLLVSTHTMKIWHQGLRINVIIQVNQVIVN